MNDSKELKFPVLRMKQRIRQRDLENSVFLSSKQTDFAPFHPDLFLGKILTLKASFFSFLPLRGWQ
jgi:hypothetical protein